METEKIKPKVTTKDLFRVYINGSLIIMSGTIVTTFFLWAILNKNNFNHCFNTIYNFFDGSFFVYLLVGFLAQSIDGALGMAYGICSTTFLMQAGVSPAFASASVHIAEIFTTAASGISHWKVGNVSKKLFKQLAIPGIIGAILGSLFLSFVDGSKIKIWIAIYLFTMGVIIFYKSFNKVLKFKKVNRIFPLAIFGGFIDASGGGGWGPIITSTFIGSGAQPRLTIGTVNAVEFLIALASSSVFTIVLGITNYKIIIGLICGGIMAAPISAFICHKINVKIAMKVVAILIMSISTFTIIKFLK